MVLERKPAAGRLDDPDFPAYTIGQAALLLGVPPGFLRGLDAVGAVVAGRSPAGHRRYSRRQLERAARIRQLCREGHPVASAARIARLEGELAAARALVARLSGSPAKAVPPERGGRWRKP